MRARWRSVLVWADWILLAPGTLGAFVALSGFASGWYRAEPYWIARMWVIAAFPLVDIVCLAVAAPVAGRPMATGRLQAAVLAMPVVVASLVLLTGVFAFA